MRRPHPQFFMVLGILCGYAYSDSIALAQPYGSRANQPQEISLNTKDGVTLKATYYPSNLGQEAVPIVMLHDHEESRAVFDSLARELQNPSQEGYSSYAVLTVDLRGHGESTRMTTPNGQTRTLEADRLKKADFSNMVYRDMEAVRKFLLKENDAGKLNLNKLCLIGSGMGANVAAAYAAYDWDVPQLAQRKQGQDVKALILASPKWSAYGLAMREPLRQADVREKLSIMLVVGSQAARAEKDANRVYKLLLKYHDDPNKIRPDQRQEKQDLFLISLPTRLQGTKLLTDPNFNMLNLIHTFLDARLMSQSFEWIPRKANN